MSNHIHLIWQPQSVFTPANIQASFMKYTAQQLKHSLTKNNMDALTSLISPAVFEQKLNYIHYNPVKAGLCINPEDYRYSSAAFYYDGTDRFGMLTHYSGN